MITTFPGFIDVHVHLRDPGSVHKEDFRSGSRAAVKGGFTYILDMPNNVTPTFSPEALEDKITRSSRNAVCDIGFHYGTNGRNLDTFPTVWNHPRVFGLKIYCNHTTGDYLIDDPILLEQVFAHWKSEKPILAHAEGEQLSRVLFLAQKHERVLHVCHVSQKDEVKEIAQVKKSYHHISAGVTPHHLFLDSSYRESLGTLAEMKPPLGTKDDQHALWDGLLSGTIDLVETDHAPHTKEEKASSTIAYGVPGLETAVGLLGSAIHEKKMTKEHLISWLYSAPQRIFHIPVQKQTSIEIDLDSVYRIGEDGYESKSGWSPFDGWTAYGKVYSVTIHGVEIMNNGKFFERSTK